MDYDVVVVGGGPSGSASAILLSKMGYNVAVVDKAKFPRDKVCGDGLSGKSVGILRELGIEDEFEEVPNRYSDGVLFSSPDGTMLEVEIPKEKQKEIHGHVIRRVDFDNLLASKAKESCTFLEEHSVIDVVKEGEKIVGVRAKGPKGIVEVRGKIVIGADGAGSIVAMKTGQGQLPPEHMYLGVRAYYDGVEGMSDKIELHFIDEVLPGYFWIFPLEGKKANVGVCMLRSDQQKSRADLKKLMEDA
ncbi:MAG: geranylgeranyl reductase family protein, partial [Bdellovibrio sp.]